MWWWRAITRRYPIPILGIPTLSSSPFPPPSPHLPSPPIPIPSAKSPIPSSSSSFSSLSTPRPPPTPPLDDGHHNSLAEEEVEDDDDEGFTEESSSAEKDAILTRDVEEIMTIMRTFGVDGAEAKKRLDLCGVSASPELVSVVISRLRNDWAAAFTFFLWAGKQPGYAHSPREYHSMISILGKLRRFDTAWSLINEMGRASPSLITPHTLMILIRRHSAVHEVAKAINAFYALKKFGFTPGIDDFHGLLSALCRYKNVEDAEHLLLCNEKTYPFKTKSFNIVLNGWCNVLVVLREAKRFWKSMESRGIQFDVVSCGSMISCFSKAGNLHDVLKLFDRMRETGIEPDRKVYNAVVYALAKSNCMKEAKDLVKRMEEKGVVPNAVTYNSLIRPLCKARRTQEAQQLFDEMIKRGLSPCIRTFHAFFHTLRTTEEVFELLGVMKNSGCRPEIETYIMLIRKLCRWQQFEKVSELWDDICVNGPGPDRSAYIVLIHGLFLNGKLEEAHKYHEEMKMKGFLPEPRTDEMVQAWLSGRDTVENSTSLGLEGKKAAEDVNSRSRRRSSNNPRINRDYLKPEIRNVSRERGFSLG